jgi:hypothetical protein
MGTRFNVASTFCRAGLSAAANFAFLLASLMALVTELAYFRSLPILAKSPIYGIIESPLMAAS